MTSYAPLATPVDEDTHVNELARQCVAALNLICSWKIAGARRNAQIDLLLIFDDCLVIKHADTLICLQWYILVLTLRLSVDTLFGKKDQIWAKIFCIPKNRHSRTPTPVGISLLHKLKWCVL